MCLLGVSGPASARHTGHAAPSRISFFSGHEFFEGGGFNTAAAHVALRSGSWIRTSHGRFATRFRDAGDAVAASSGHSGGIQCVTFARADSGIELEGNANTWWDHAAGLYQRGSRPEPGSVLNFRANGAMRMGHVAVVNMIVDGRTVVVDHANWGSGGRISRAVSVVDVSPANDWTAVRVGLGRSGDYGSIYPTFGFIYNRPDRGMMVAAAAPSAAMPMMNPAPRDLRGSARDSVEEEVAEAPEVEGRRSYAYGGGYSRYGRHRHFVVFNGRGSLHDRGFLREHSFFHERGFGSRAGVFHVRSVGSHAAPHRRHRI